MFCPVCGFQNLATSIRCVQCGTTLIDRSEDHSAEYRKAEDRLNLGIATGIGSIAGYLIALLALKVLLADLDLSDQQVYGGALGGAAAGGIVVRLVRRWGPF